MAIEDLFNGLNAFTQGVKEYTTSKAIGEATDQLNQLNQSAVSDQQKRVAQMQLGNQLALHLQQLGAPQEQIAGTTAVVKPVAYSNPLDMYMQAKLTGKEDQAKQAMQLQQAMVVAPAEKVAAQAHAYKMAELTAEDPNKLLLAQLKAQQEQHPLPATEVEKLNSFDEARQHIATMKDMVSSDSGLVGPLNAKKPLRSQFKDTAQFDMVYNNFANDYIKAMTGAQMGEAEATRLFKALVKPDMLAGTFQAGLDRLDAITTKKRDIHIKNATELGFKTGVQGQRLQAGGSSAPAPSISQQETTYTDPKTGITWKGIVNGTKFQATGRLN